MAEWKMGKILHGGDYNPDQWRDRPDILDEDMRLMKLAGCDLMSVGIFAWSALEPKEGVFTFEWLDDVLDRLHQNGVKVFLATPSGARPAWMSQKYPEVLRVREDGLRNFHGVRHNHCFSSPMYREKVLIMNRKLAERYGRHPAVVGWHISNEYGGTCYCPHCQAAFVQHLKNKFGDIDALNHAWWTDFWSHRYNDFSQIEPPSRVGEASVDGLTMEWRRFTTRQTVDFMQNEIAPIRELTPDLPVTTNFMLYHYGLDYFRFQDVLDVVSWDSYPMWKSTPGSLYDYRLGIRIGFWHDVMRCVKQKPFLLMESTPSTVNWQEVCKLKRPGMHMLSSLHAVAHGADSVQYFQWRKSRGAFEKHHGAVVDHAGGEHTRVFRDVAQVGEVLGRLTGVAGSMNRPQAALVFDWDNRWAIDIAKGPRADKQYDDTCVEHYAALRRCGVDVDVIDSEQPFDGYRLLVLPMLYMLKPGVADRIRAFTQNGGTVVATYHTGVVDENSLCFSDLNPAGLDDVFGIWAEEIDALYDDEMNAIVVGDKSYECGFLCQLIHARGAKVLGTYGMDFYRGRPAFTLNDCGKGKACYLASRTGADFLEKLYQQLTQDTALARPLENRDLIEEGIEVSLRETEGTATLFLMNFTDQMKHVALPDRCYNDLICGGTAGGSVALAPWGVSVLQYNI